MKYVYLWFFFLILSQAAYAVGGKTTYQAKIIKPDGYPLEATSVNFKFTILDPTGSCVLYSETYTAVNMNNTGGLIFFSLGAGNRTYPTSGAATLASVFDNSTVSFPCETPGLYAPTSADNRKIVMQFNDGSGWQTLPAMSINAVPFSMYAGKADNSVQLNGKSDIAFVEYSALASLNCQSNEAIKFNGVSFGCIAVSSSTTVTSGSVITALGYTPADEASVSTVSSSVFSVSSTVSTLAGSVSSLQSSMATSFAAITSSQWSNVTSGISYLSGNVGIGTSNPTYVMHINGNLDSSGNAYNPKLQIDGNAQKFATAAIYSDSTDSNFSRSYLFMGTRNSNLASTSGGQGATIILNNYRWDGINNIQNLAGDVIGELAFRGSTASGYQNTAAIQVATASGTDAQMHFRIQNNSGPTTGHPIRMTLNSAGNVGVGTTSPQATLDVSGTGYFSGKVMIGDSSLTSKLSVGGYYPSITIKDTLNAAGTASGTNSNFVIQARPDGSVWNIFTNGSGTRINMSENASGTFGIGYNGQPNFFTATVSGNVGVGTSVPTAKLHIAAGTSSDAPFKFTSGTLLVSPQSGTVEYNGSDFYFTDGTNTRRSLSSYATSLTSSTITSALGYTPANDVAVINLSSTVATSFAATASSFSTVTNNINSVSSSVSSLQASTAASFSAITSSQWTTSGSAVFYNAGNVGIGTINPTQSLAVSGSIDTTGSVYFSNNPSVSGGIYGGSYVGNNGGVYNPLKLNQLRIYSDTYTTNGVLFYTEANSPIAFGSTGNYKAVLQNNLLTAAGGNTSFALGSSVNLVTQSIVGGQINQNAATPAYGSLTIVGGPGSGTNVIGSSLTLAGGQGTGTASGGDIVFQTASASGSGASLNSLTERMRIKSSGNIGVGTSSPTSRFNIVASAADTQPAVKIDGTATSQYALSVAGDGAATLYASNSGGFSAIQAVGNLGQGLFASSNSTDGVFATTNGGVGFAAVEGRSNGSAAGVMGYSQSGISGFFKTFNNSGTNTNPTLVTRLNSNQTADLFQAQNASGTSLFNISNVGNVGIGTTTPSAKLQIAAGTSVTASLKITSGTLLTAAQDGAIEYDGTNLYYTDSTNTRRALASTGSGQTFSGTNTFTGVVNVSNNTASTNSSTGAFVVSGGVGIGGVLNVSGSIATTSNIQGASVTATSGMISPYIAGSIASAGTLTLDSTTHSSKGNILLAPNGGKVGIGTTTPISKLTVSGNTLFDRNGTVTTLGSGGSDFNFVGGARFFSAGVSDLSGQSNTSVGSNLVTFSGGGGGNIATIGGSVVLTLNADHPTNGVVAFQTASVEKMRISNSGNVGIGVTTPQGELHVNDGSGTTAEIRLTNSSTGATATDGFNIRAQNSDVTLNNFESGDMLLATSNSERLRITSTGNVGIGTANPMAKLQVTSSDYAMHLGEGASGAGIDFKNRLAALPTSGTLATIAWMESTSGLPAGSLLLSSRPSVGGVALSGNGGVNLYVNQNGNVGIGTTSATSKLTVMGPSPSLPSDGQVSVYGSETTGAANTGGGIVFNGHDGTNPGRAWGSVQALKENSTLGDVASYMRLSTRTAGNGLAEKVRITSSGNVGIGTTSPAGKLHIAGAGWGDQTAAPDSSTFPVSGSDGVIIDGNYSDGTFRTRLAKIDRGGNLPLYIQQSVGTANSYVNLARFGAHVNSTNTFEVFGNTAISGNVGIGTTTSTSPLDVTVTDASSGIVLTNTNSTTNRYPLVGVVNYAGGASGHPVLSMSNSSGTSAAPAALISGMNVGTLLWSGQTTASQTMQAARIDAVVESNFGANAAPTRLEFSVAPSSGSYVKRMVINSAGNVGIGTTSPSSYQHGGTNRVTEIHNSGTASNSQAHIMLSSGNSTNADSAIGTITFAQPNMSDVNKGLALLSGTTDSDFTVSAPTSRLNFWTRGAAESNWSTKMVIKGNGNVGIGITNPTALLHVNGTALATAWNTSSDQRLKENIKPIENSVNKILQLRGVEFDWRKDMIAPTKHDEIHDIGVIAQEVEKVFPEAVTTPKTGFKSVAYSKLVAPLIEGFKSLYYRMAGFESDLSEQKRQISSIRGSKADKADTEALKAENAQLKQENAAIKAYLCGKDPAAPICK